MSKLPVISGARCTAALSRIGYAEVRRKGSHVRLECAGRSPVTVPLHDELDRGTLRAIIRVVGLSVDELIALLR